MAKYILFSSGHWSITQSKKNYTLEGTKGFRVSVELCHKEIMCFTSDFFVDDFATEDQIKKEVNERIKILFRALEYKSKALNEEFNNMKHQLA